MSAPAPTSIDAGLAAFFAHHRVIAENPYPLYRRMRQESAVHRFGRYVYLTRYADIHAALKDTRRFSKVPAPIRVEQVLAELPPAEAGGFREVLDYEAAQMNRKDDPDHARLRRIAHRAFTPRWVASMEGTIQQITDELLDAVAAAGDADLISTFAYPLPLLVIFAMLGVPREHQQDVRAWSATIEEFRDQEVPDLDRLAAAVEAYRSFRVMVQELVDLHRDKGRSAELFGTLVDAVGPDGMSKEELVSMFVLLLFAGHVTTTNLVANGVLALLGNRATWDRLCDGPKLADAVVEEALRFDAPVQFNPRTAREDFELHGVDVHAGDTVRLVFGSANRDEAEFADPDRFDVDRDNNARHLAFGFGPYFCLGAALARLEGQVAFATLARRFPALERTGGELEWRPTGNLRGVAALPVRLR